MHKHDVGHVNLQPACVKPTAWSWCKNNFLFQGFTKEHICYHVVVKRAHEVLQLRLLALTGGILL